MRKFQRTKRAFGLTPFASAALSSIAMLALSSCQADGLERSRTASSDVARSTSHMAAMVDATCGLSDFQAQILAQVNARRAAGAVCGTRKMSAAASLAWNAQLHQAATLHALNMATTGAYSHTGSHGLTLPQRADAAGYDYALLAENIDAQRTSVHAAISSWMNSPQHCENIMRTQFRDIGVSCVRNSASQWGNYWTMELGVRR